MILGANISLQFLQFSTSFISKIRLYSSLRGMKKKKRTKMRI